MSAPVAPPVSGYSIASLLGISDGLSTGDARRPLPGTGKSGPAGIESVIEYNTLFMNVRDWVDTYLVTNIGGLDDADVRDSREPNPGYHGETAYKGFYGGRTITLTGKVYAHTLFKLRDMQQGLRQAFAQLDDELPLVFRTPNPNLDMMIDCKKSQPIQMADEQRTANHFERPFQIILRASNPRFLSVVRVQNSFSFANLYDFTQPRTVIKETFDDPGVLNLYNAQGDGFKVDTGMLRSNGKSNATNYVHDADFNSASAVPSRSVTGGTFAKVASGGVDDGAYGVISDSSTAAVLTYTGLPIPTAVSGTRYSASIWVRSPSPASFHFELEWMQGSTSLSLVGSEYLTLANQWKEVKLENIPVPVGANKFNLGLYFYNPQAGASYCVDKIIVSDGSKLPAGGFFDASNPLIKWGGDGTPYVNSSIMYPYTVLTTNRLFTDPMMTVKVNIPAGDGTHQWSGQDIEPEGFRIVLAYIDDDNQVYVTVKGIAGQNFFDPVLVVWRNGERETYQANGLMNMDFQNLRSGDKWYRAFMKSGEVVFEQWAIDPYSGVTDGQKNWEYWKLTPEQSALFEQTLPMQLVMFDQQYSPSAGVTNQDTWRFDEMTYQSVEDLAEWDYVTATAGILNGTPVTYNKSSLYVSNNALHQLWGNSAFILRNDLPALVGDGSISVKIRYDDPLGSDSFNFGIIGKYVDKDSFIYAGLNLYSAANMTIYISTPANMASSGGGFFQYLDFPKTDFPEDTDRWLRLTMAGNTFTVDLLGSDPSTGPSPIRTKSGTLTGAGIAKLGAGVKGRVGLTVGNMAPSASIDDYVITQNSINDTVLLPVNNGNFRAQPVIEIAGPMTNLILTNEANDEWMSIPTTIPGGETWVLDIENHRMYRKSDEANRFQYLDANSDWMELEPGENPISASSSGMGAASQVSIGFHHTVM